MARFLISMPGGRLWCLQGKETPKYFAAKQMHCRIIIAGRRSPYEIARRLLTILNYVAAGLKAELEAQLLEEAVLNKAIAENLARVKV